MRKRFSFIVIPEEIYKIMNFIPGFLIFYKTGMQQLCRNKQPEQIFPAAPAIGFYSLLKLFTGFAIAAFIAWKLTVPNAINITNTPARANMLQLRLIRYG